MESNVVFFKPTYAECLVGQKVAPATLVGPSVSPSILSEKVAHASKCVIHDSTTTDPL